MSWLNFTMIRSDILTQTPVEFDSEDMQEDFVAQY